MSEKEPGPNRRQFLKGAAGVGAAIGVGAFTAKNIVEHWKELRESEKEAFAIITKKEAVPHERPFLGYADESDGRKRIQRGDHMFEIINKLSFTLKIEGLDGEVQIPIAMQEYYDRFSEGERLNVKYRLTGTPDAPKVEVLKIDKAE